MGAKICAPREDAEQAALFEWAALSAGAWPELKLMYHIPNEGKRSYAGGGMLKRLGLKSGVPDICLPISRGGFGALYVEMKRRAGSKVSESQKDWIERLNAAGNKAIICYGWEDAAAEIQKYLKSGAIK